MERYIYGVAVAAAVGIAVYVLINRPRWIFRGLCRGLLLSAALVAARLIFSTNPIIMQIGLNPYTIGVFSFLGIPGAALVAGVQTLIFLCG